jgi:hypothetical protein
MVTMSQKSSVPQTAKSVSQALIPDKLELCATRNKLARCSGWFAHCARSMGVFPPEVNLGRSHKLSGPFSLKL